MLNVIVDCFESVVDREKWKKKRSGEKKKKPIDHILHNIENESLKINRASNVCTFIPVYCPYAARGGE